MNIADNLDRIKKSIPPEVCLVAVSKTKPNASIQEAYNVGHRDFGENKVQELVSKWEKLPKDIKWHFIGHLQSNKVKYIAPFVHLLHGVDSFKLLKTINKEGLKNDRKIDCLLQVKIAEEDSKFGLSMEEVRSLYKNNVMLDLPNVRVVGLMGMGTNTYDLESVKNEFLSLKSFFNELKESTFTSNEITILSMGMSGDYSLAIDCGSNMVRVGSSIFGQREYKK